MNGPATARLVAIHQPNFFPWLGYFAKIARAEWFVFLDDAQFSKTGGTYSNRVRLAPGGRPAWITMPVVRAYHGFRRVNEMAIDDGQPWRSRLAKTLFLAFRRAPRFDEVYPVIEPLIDTPAATVAEFNRRTVRSLAAALGLPDDRFRVASELAIAGSGSERLARLTRAVGGNAYLCGVGAKKYQVDGPFADAGVDLVRQDFVHPVYSRFDAPDFVPGLSILDALMNVGFSATRRLIDGELR